MVHKKGENSLEGVGGLEDGGYNTTDYGMKASRAPLKTRIGWFLERNWFKLSVLILGLIFVIKY